jgi:hypothetical protein
VGTVASLVPVRSITRRPLGDRIEYGNGGIRYRTLLKILDDIRSGRRADEFVWCDVVEFESASWGSGCGVM